MGGAHASRRDAARLAMAARSEACSAWRGVADAYARLPRIAPMFASSQVEIGASSHAWRRSRQYRNSARRSFWIWSRGFEKSNRICCVFTSPTSLTCGCIGMCTCDVAMPDDSLAFALTCAELLLADVGTHALARFMEKDDKKCYDAAEARCPRPTIEVCYNCVAEHEAAVASREARGGHEQMARRTSACSPIDP